MIRSVMPAASMGTQGATGRLRLGLAVAGAVLALTRVAGAWSYVTISSPAYGRTNYVNPASIVLGGSAVDYLDAYSAYGIVTGVTVWADGQLVGGADVHVSSNQTTWSLTWTNPPAPPAAAMLTAVSFADSGQTATSRVGISISPTNRPPVALPASARTVEVTPVTIQPNYQHGDADQTGMPVVVTQPANGAVTVDVPAGGGGMTGGSGTGNEPGDKGSPTLRYVPNAGFLGTDTFAFVVSDGFDDSNVTTGTVTVATNTPPAARNTTNTVVVGATAIAIYPAYSDPDSAVQTIVPTVVSDPTFGRVDVSNTAYRSFYFLYAVPTGFVGRDTFAYKVNDGLADSNVATGTVNVITNTPPWALPLRASTAPTATVTLAVAYTDPDVKSGVSQTFTVRATAPPAHGALTTNHLAFAYTPEPGFAGIDSFRFAVSDGVDESGEAEARIQVRARNDRAGNGVAVIVASNLYADLAAEVDRLCADLRREGYTCTLRQWPSTGSSVSNLWTYLKGQCDDTNVWMTGAILIGNLPKSRVTIGGKSYYTDQVYWNLGVFDTENMPSRRDIWVGRIIAEDTTYGSEATLVRRSLDANHAYRTGASRLPDTACYFINPEWWAGYSNAVPRLLDVWPSLEARGASASTLRFLPQRADLSGYAGADAFARGGEVLDETSHGNSDGYMANGGWFNRASLFRVVAQQRVALITSCTCGAYGGIVNQTIFTRGGGCVLAVGGSDINYVGDFTIVGSSRERFRAALAAGESWGGAMLASYPFGGAERTIMYGDPSLPAMAAGTSNALPRIAGWSCVEKGGRQVTFRVDADDPDGAIGNVEWFCEGYDAGRRAPSYAGPEAGCTYTYPAPGTYPVRVEVVDDGQAREWREFTVTVAGPPVRPMLTISADDRIAALYLDGQSNAVGPNAATWNKADTYFADALTCVAVQAVNDQPTQGYAGVAARLYYPDGHAEISDNAWKAWDGTTGAPTNDAQGRPWYAPDYDDSGWPPAVVAGAWGASPWGDPPDLAMLKGARWIWIGDPARGVSPVYLRGRFASWTAIDSDGDGMTDADESIAGTDRTNGASRFTVRTETSEGSGALRFDAVSGRCYTVEWRPDLSTGLWAVLPDWSNAWSPTSGPVVLPLTTGAERAFYRLRVAR